VPLGEGAELFPLPGQVGGGTSSGSAIGVSGAIGIRPRVTPGYSAMCSVVTNDSNPHSSACRATADTCSGAIPKKPAQPGAPTRK
jgi:hypothetical protein